MTDTAAAPPGGGATDLQQEWDRLEQADRGGQPSAPDPTDEPPAPAQQDDQGQASRPPAEPAAATPAGDEPQTDIWANAPPELKAARDAEIARLEQAARSQGGRAQAEAKRNAELAAELEALRKQQQPAPAEPQAPKLTDEARNQLREEYPDVAAPLLDVVGELEKEVKRLAAANASQEEQRQAASALELQRHYAAEEQRLTEAHSDWATVAATDGFGSWIKTQPRMIQEALARNANQITDADEAAEIIGRYKSTLSDGGLQARREAQRRGSEVPRPRTGVPTPSITTDAKSEWDRLDALDRQREAQRGGARSSR